MIICGIHTLMDHERYDCAVAAQWDMLVVDEAHHLALTPESVSPEYALVEALSQQSEGLLLLTATPEQLGAEGHFARLRLLDPDRYPDLDGFLREQADYTGIAQVADKLSSGADLSDEEFVYLDRCLPSILPTSCGSACRTRRSCWLNWSTGTVPAG